MDRRTLLAALASAPLFPALARGRGPEARATGPGERIAIPGARAIDHAGQVVPDLEQAVAFFAEVFGAAVLWRSAPFTADGRGPKVPDGINADPRSLSRLCMMRLGPNLNVELIEYRVPGTARAMPLSSDLGVGHIALDVDDVAVAGAYLRGKGVEMLEGPRRNASGPNAGQDSWFFVAPWGMVIEMIHRPPGMPYERETTARLFKAPPQIPAQDAARPAMDAPGILWLEEERTAALLRGDRATLERLTAAEAIHIESNGVARTTPEFLAQVGQGGAKFATFVVEENAARFYGASAVATGRYRNSLRTASGMSPLKRARHTRVWAPGADGAWRVVSHQATEIAAE